MLEVKGLTKRFGGLQALAKVELTFPDSGVAGVIGPNGSGKSTLFNVISGFYRPDEGEVRLNGRRLSHLPAHRVAHAGIVRTFQLSRSFTGLSVRENCLVAAAGRQGERVGMALFARSVWKAQERKLSQEVDEVLERVGLSAKAEDLAGGLSYGQQKLLELARALVARPKVLLLDEPTAGVNPALVERLSVLVRGIAEEGRLVVVIEHNMPFVMTLCKTIHVLDHGEVIATGEPAAVQQDSRVLDAYLGEGRSHA